MRGLAVAVLLIGILAFSITSLRWLRVAQREHYLPGSASRFAIRWWRASMQNVGALVLAVVSFGICVTWLPGGVVAGVVLVVAPLGLGIRGRTSALAWTGRLRRLASILVALAAVAIGLGALVGGLHVAAVAAVGIALVAPGLVDLALALVAPLENRFALRYVTQAQAVLGRISPRVVAITGSFGKTSTKGYLAQLLSARFSVLASPRSYNNRAGLARTVNELLLPGTDVLIAEMGTYGKGEIADMVAWLPPEVAVLTAIGPVHLERFGTLRAILAAKREIAVGARVVVVNSDDELLSELAEELERAGQQVIRCSSRILDAKIAVVERGDEIAVVIDGVEAGTANLGRARSSIALGNVACAIGAALALGATASEILPLLDTLPIAENRLTRVVGASGAIVIDDTYNSNPKGTGLALEALVGAATPNHAIVVVSPGMVELGRIQREENAKFAAAVAKIATHFLVVGRTNRAALLAGARDASLDGARCEIRLVKDRAAAVALVQRDFGAGDVVLYENDLPDHYA